MAVGKALGEAIQKSYGAPEGALGVQRVERGQRSRDRVRDIEPRVEDSDSDESGEGSEEEGSGLERHYEVECLKGARQSRQGQQFLVAWKGFPDESWEFEVDLVEEGAKESVDVYLLTHTRRGAVRKGCR